MLTTQEIQKVRQYLGQDDHGLAEVFSVLSEPNRCKMFRSIAKSQELSVSDVATILHISLPLASQHLKLMHRSDLLIKVKHGRTTVYSLNNDNTIVRSILNAIA